MEPYIQAIIAIIAVLFFIFLIWLFCLRRIGTINKEYVKLREPEEFDNRYNLQNLVRDSFDICCTAAAHSTGLCFKYLGHFKLEERPHDTSSKS